jgi:hypothetical protein
LQIPRKVVHGGPSLIYDKFSGIAIEPEGYIDAINNPEWGVDQICEFSLSGEFIPILIAAYQTIQGETSSGRLRTSSLL